MGVATAVAAAGAVFVASPARADGLSLGVGASTDSPPTGEAAAESSAPAPSPEADTPAAESSSDSGRDKKPANYEFGFVTVGAYQTWAIAGDTLYFGAGGGVGPPLYRYGKLGPHSAGWDKTLEIAYANAFLRLKLGHAVDVDVGPKIALGSALYDVQDAPQTAFSYGACADLRFGTETVKFGPRFEYDRIAYSSFYENGWRLTPLMVRITH